MLVRILSSLLGCAIIIPVLIFSETWAFPIFMALVCFISVFEMMRCIGVHKKYYLTAPLCLIGAAMPVLARLSSVYSKIEIGFCALAVCAIIAIYLLTVSLFSREKFNIERNSIAIVGDKLYDNMKLGIDLGLATILVLSGQSTMYDVEMSDIEPTFVFDSIKNIYENINDALNGADI